MPLTIRRVGLDDLDPLVPLFDAYRVFYGQPSDPARARAYLHERLSRGESVVLLAEHDGVAAGFTQLYPMFSSVRTGRLWVLNDLYVDAQVRRGGTGRALLDAAAAFARVDGAVGIVLETTRDNASARALYRSAGWEEEQTQWYSLSFAPGAGQAANERAADEHAIDEHAVDTPAHGEPLFSYGTLQDETVQQRLFGRRLSGTADALPGFRMDWLEERDPAAVAASGIVRHPVVHETRSPDDRVPGTLFRVTAAELAHADEYEGSDYRRVRVTLASGASAWLYAATTSP